MKAGQVKRIRRDTKRLFLKKGTCSRAVFFIVDREFGHPQDDEERAAERILRTFFEAAGSELDCRVIAGRSFPTVADHTEFIGAGGCGSLIQALAGAVSLR